MADLLERDVQVTLLGAVIPMRDVGEGRTPSTKKAA